MKEFDEIKVETEIIEEIPETSNGVDTVLSSEEVLVKDRQEDRKETIRLAIIFAICLLAVFIARVFVFEPFTIPSGSMESTIMTGDNVIAEKLSYVAGEPKVGDIVVFDSITDDKLLIKRVIATEGQVIDIQDGNLYIDGVLQDEPYTRGLPTEKQIISYPYTVPDDCIWVMGDNRTNSADSRTFGAVPVDNVVGKALFIYLPFNHIGWIAD